MLEILKLHWILASASPRRKQLLEWAGIRPEVWRGAPDESLPQDTPAMEWGIQAAKKKADWFKHHRPAGSILLTADTTVILDNSVVNKPSNQEEAFAMLRRLNGRSHLVVTGVCLITDEAELSFSEKTEVTFDKLPENFLWEYAYSGKGLDKAGAYGAQDNFGVVGIRSINGCYYNVMGLPVNRIFRELRQLYSRNLSIKPQ
jgi:septum formation protein